MGKIVHGNSNFGYAPINYNSSTHTYSFGTPVMMEGMVSATTEFNQEDIKIPADNNPSYAIIKGKSQITSNATFRYIPKEYAEYLGYKADANGGLTDTGSYPAHCIFYETIEEDPNLNVKTQTLHYLYQVVGSQPTIESRTDEETIEAREIGVDYSAQESFVTDDDGIAVKYYTITRDETNANLYDTFKTAVILPNATIPSV